MFGARGGIPFIAMVVLSGSLLAMLVGMKYRFRDELKIDRMKLQKLLNSIREA